MAFFVEPRKHDGDAFWKSERRREAFDHGVDGYLPVLSDRVEKPNCTEESEYAFGKLEHGDRFKSFRGG